MDTNQIRMLVTTTAQIAAKIALSEAGLIKKEIIKAEAYRRYGRKFIDRSIKNGSLVPVFRGSKALISVIELETLAKTNQLITRHYSDAL